jgi:hypothetical protein
MAVSWAPRPDQSLGAAARSRTLTLTAARPLPSRSGVEYRAYTEADDPRRNLGGEIDIAVAGDEAGTSGIAGCRGVIRID